MDGNDRSLESLRGRKVLLVNWSPTCGFCKKISDGLAEVQDTLSDRDVDLVFVTSGFQGNNLKAIRLASARGDITGTDSIVWTLDHDTPYVPSPLLYDNVLYLLKTNSGILSAFDAPTGKPHYRLQRLDGLPEVFSSPVGANGRIYIAGRDGVTHVIRHGSTYELLAKNKLDDGFDASPALVDNEIFLRGYQFLYSIAER